jgi:hypothetical protein
MAQYQETGIPTSEACELVNELFLPDSVLTQIQALDADKKTEALKNHFRRFNIIGYSYGTSLVQQVEQVLESRLETLGYDKSVLREVAAVNIGPVAQPRILSTKGNISRMSIHQDAGNTSSLFSQLFVLGHTDKISHQTIGNAFLNPANENLSLTGNRHVKILVDHAGDEMLKRAGISVFASGFKSPKLDYSFDYEGHALRLYTNKLELQASADGAQMICFPSKALSPTIAAALKQMAVESKSGIEMARDFQNAATPEIITASSSEFDAIRQEFNTIMQNYRMLGFDSGLAMLEKTVAEFPALSARYPVFS